jgi:hypothetical protein
MIQAVCFTNLDGFEREVWPTSFPVAPRLGDRVESESGKVLVVVGITWKAIERSAYDVATPKQPRGHAYVRIELHQRF